MQNEQEIRFKLEDICREIDEGGDYRYLDAIKDALEWVLGEGDAI